MPIRREAGHVRHLVFTFPNEARTRFWGPLPSKMEEWPWVGVGWAAGTSAVVVLLRLLVCCRTWTLPTDTNPCIWLHPALLAAPTLHPHCTHLLIQHHALGALGEFCLTSFQPLELLREISQAACSCPRGDGVIALPLCSDAGLRRATGLTRVFLQPLICSCIRASAHGSFVSIHTLDWLLCRPSCAQSACSFEMAV